MYVLYVSLRALRRFFFLPSPSSSERLEGFFCMRFFPLVLLADEAGALDAADVGFLLAVDAGCVPRGGQYLRPRHDGKAHLGHIS